jgi:hypothetical protein
MSVTAGALLRDAREAAGLHIAALAVALKVPVAKLEALEADNFSALPDMVFVRALASSVCRTLKIDPQAVLALLPQGEGPRLSAGDVGLNAPVKGFAGRSSAAPFKGAGSRSFVWAVGLLLIGAALMMFLPRGLDADLSALLKQPETTTKIPMPTGNVAQEISVAVGAEQRVPSAAPAPAVQLQLQLQLVWVSNCLLGNRSSLLESLHIPSSCRRWKHLPPAARLPPMHPPVFSLSKHVASRGYRFVMRQVHWSCNAIWRPMSWFLCPACCRWLL